MSFSQFLLYRMYKSFKSLRNSVESKTRRPKRFWMRDHLQDNARHTLGHYYKLILPAKTRDREYFHRMMRMSPECFDELTELVRPLIQRQFIAREPISVEERLALTIRYVFIDKIMIMVN